MAKESALDIRAMSIDELWELHEELGRLLSIRLSAEKRQLEKKLAQLRRDNPVREGSSLGEGAGERRNYPRVVPKYQNPNEPSETWSGRGKQPRWLAAALETGRSIDEFMIRPTQNGRAGSRRR